MTDKNYTHIVTVVDRSGSMFHIAKDMCGALDQYFSDQAKMPGKVLVDYVQFDGNVELVFEDKFITDAKAVLEPRGSTALLDAIGFAVTNLGKKLANLPESRRPGLVQVVVVTDGHENSSREWTADAVRKLIKQQEEEYAWDFVFLGANMDAVSVGTGFGFQAGKSLTYNVKDTGSMSSSLSSYTTATRSAVVSGASADVIAFTDEDRAANA